jgi:hypothetical protein
MSISSRLRFPREDSTVFRTFIGAFCFSAGCELLYFIAKKQVSR